MTPEYGWRDSSATHAHKYLLPAIDRAIFSNLTVDSSILHNIKLFDAGCGNGVIAHYYSSKGFAVAGCDASENGVEIARQTSPGCRFEVFSVYDDMVGEFGLQDIVLSSEVVEHLYMPRKYLGQVNRLLRPGGLLILTTPYHGYLKNVALSLSGAMDRHFTVLWDGGHIKFWSYKTLKTVLSEMGFTDFKFYGAGRMPLLWKSMVVSAVKKQAEG